MLTHLPGSEVSRMQGYQVLFLFLEKTTRNRQYWRNGRLHLRQELQEHLEKKMGRERFAHLKSPWCASSKDNRFWTLRHICEYNVIKELIFYCSEHIKNTYAISFWRVIWHMKKQTRLLNGDRRPCSGSETSSCYKLRSPKGREGVLGIVQIVNPDRSYWINVG